VATNGCGTIIGASLVAAAFTGPNKISIIGPAEISAGSFKLTNVEMLEPSDSDIREELSDKGILVGVVGDTFQKTFGAPSRLCLRCIPGIVSINELLSSDKLKFG
jgi:hypothetical protein